jgi:hypothetical protein
MEEGATQSVCKCLDHPDSVFRLKRLGSDPTVLEWGEVSLVTASWARRQGPVAELRSWGPPGGAVDPQKISRAPELIHLPGLQLGSSRLQTPPWGCFALGDTQNAWLLVFVHWHRNGGPALCSAKSACVFQPGHLSRRAWVLSVWPGSIGAGGLHSWPCDLLIQCPPPGFGGASNAKSLPKLKSEQLVGP